MTNRRFLAALAIPALLLTGEVQAQTGLRVTKDEGSVLPALSITEYRLANGLRVILHQDRSTPIVGVNLWYHVGSKNEVLGRTGFAHLFEHMMFQGFEGYDDDYFLPLQEAGATLNGSTSVDRTNYYQVLPSNSLELALFMESGRMSRLLQAMTEEKLANQRDVVKNEKRQRLDNQPYGGVPARMSELLYPRDHPYHWLTIGSLEDLTAASMDDVKDFFRRFYTPNNASLSIAGDFDVATTRALIEKYFGPIPSGQPIPALKPTQPVLAGEVRDTLLDRVSLSRSYITWHGVPAYHPDEPALDALASILGGGRSSRLYQALMYDRQLAQTVSAGNPAMELAGRFQVVATATPTSSLGEIEAIIDAEIARIQKEPPTAEEVARFYNDFESSFIYGLQTVQGKGDQLNRYSIQRGTAKWFEEDLARYRQVTPADVQRVARQYLTNRRLIMTVLPQPRGPVTSSVAAPARDIAAAALRPILDNGLGGGVMPDVVSDTGRRDALPKSGPNPTFRLPAAQRRTLGNGLRVVVVEHHEMPVVGMQLIVNGGAAADPAGRAGLASLTADLLDEGTATRNALALARDIEAIGARLSSSSDWDANSLSLTTTTRQLDPALALFSDVLLNPAVNDSDLERIRRQRLGGLAQRRDNPNIIAATVYNSLLYGREHPYGHTAFGDEASLRQISRADIRSFYEQFYRPNNATLIVVGDVTAATIVPKLERAFASWSRGDVPAVPVSAAPAPRDRATIYLIDKPGAAQSVISIGSVAVARSTEDFYPLLVMNTILGGQFASRVNLNLRENKGYTYGARTALDYRRGPGPFSASADVVTANTKESVIEFLKELRGIRGEIPVTQAELDFARQSVIRGFPRTFETPQQIAGRLGTLALHGLPPNYYDSYIQRVAAVTVADVQRVAQKYLDPSRMAILVVGDRAVIEPRLREIEGAGNSIVHLDSEGNPAR